MDGNGIERATAGVAPILLALFAGTAMAFMSVALIGRTAAIPMPGAYVAGFVDGGMRDLALLAWSTAVVAGPGLGVPALLAGALLALAFPARRGGVIAAFVCAILASLYVVVPVVYGEEIVFLRGRPWWSFGNEISLAIAVAIMTGVGRFLRARH